MVESLEDEKRSDRLRISKNEESVEKSQNSVRPDRRLRKRQIQMGEYRMIRYKAFREMI